jgi:hypothetical protein
MAIRQRTLDSVSSFPHRQDVKHKNSTVQIRKKEAVAGDDFRWPCCWKNGRGRYGDEDDPSPDAVQDGRIQPGAQVSELQCIVSTSPFNISILFAYGFFLRTMLIFGAWYCEMAGLL